MLSILFYILKILTEYSLECFMPHLCWRESNTEKFCLHLKISVVLKRASRLQVGFVMSLHFHIFKIVLFRKYNSAGRAIFYFYFFKYNLYFPFTINGLFEFCCRRWDWSYKCLPVFFNYCTKHFVSLMEACKCSIAIAGPFCTKF